MNKILRLSLIAVLAFVFNGAFAQTTVTFDATTDTPASGGSTAGEQTITKDGITITISNGMMNGSQYRCYKNATMTITSTVGNINQIDLTCTANGTSNYGPGNFTADAGTYTASTGKTGTWTGDAASIVFTTTAQVRMTEVKVTYGGTPTVVDISNTAETAYTIAKAHELIAAGEGLSTEVYVKGIVTSVSSYNSSYGSITYYLGDSSDDSNPLQIYSGLYYDGEKFNAKSDLEVGDEIVVKGLLKSYNGTDEMDKSSVIITHKRDGKDVTPSEGVDITNTPENAYSVAKAIELIAAGEGLSNKVYVKGYVVGTPSISTSYGNATYLISDTKGDETTTITVYRGYSLNGEKFTSEDEISAGDEVIVYGTLTLYGTTNEINSGSSIYSINGETTGISSISSDKLNVNAPVYNLAGQRVSRHAKGLLIQNGKKFVNK